MSQSTFCESCGAPLTPGSNVCSACGQPVGGSQSISDNEVSAENWSKPVPNQTQSSTVKTDRWGSPQAGDNPDSAQRWGSPQLEHDTPPLNVPFTDESSPSSNKKPLKWLLIAIAVLLGLCICVVAAGYGGYTLIAGS